MFGIFFYSGISACRGQNESESASGLRVVACPSFRSVFDSAGSILQLRNSRPWLSYCYGVPPLLIPLQWPKLLVEPLKALAPASS